MTEGEIYKKMKDYNRSNIPLAKNLRANMTKWERKLWYEFLRNYPVRFQRQKALDNYIADFYCAKAQLVIELDGRGHDLEEQFAHDQKRTAALKAMGLQILRIANTEIERDFKTVCERIHILVCKSLPPSPTATPPSSEGG